MTATIEQTTGNVLAEMLKENTGRALCDSGDYYGRNYERNAMRDFESESESYLSFRYGIELSHNVYHWLKERLDYDVGMDQQFIEFADKNDGNSWLADMEAFADHLSDDGHEVTGLYGEDDYMVVNTYNHQSLLGQTIQYLYMEVDETPYVLLQIHGGCDVRGGYTRPRAFKLSCYDAGSFFSDQDGSIYCEGHKENPDQGKLFDILPEEHRWSTDDGYHYYRDGACGAGAGTQLEAYDTKEIESLDEWEKGFLCVDDDGNGYCPECGAKLHGSPY